MLDGASRIGEMFEAVADYDMPACAITDHGVMYGALDFYKTGIKTGVKPIIGMEGYLFGGDRREKPGQRENSANDLSPHPLGGRQHRLSQPREDLVTGVARRLPLLATLGLGDSLDLLRGAYMPVGVPERPDPEGNRGGGLRAKAKRFVGQYKELFGDRFYIELQDHGHPPAGAAER